jgi:hypothetical protein
MPERYHRLKALEKLSFRRVRFGKAIFIGTASLSRSVTFLQQSKAIF